MILGNTYHLYLRPGHEVVAELGGLHRFMQWDGPILTDSGGYQVFSMSELRRIDDDGVSFRAPYDGSDHRLTPERSMEIQAALGSDIAMVFDECPPGDATRADVERAVARTTAWARRSLAAYTGPGVPFGIVQGGVFPELRERSALELLELDFPGYAIGGVSVGEPDDAVMQTVGRTAEMLPENRPRYLMGVGRPIDLVQAVGQGIDMFDCVMPTRNARCGTLFTSRGRVNIKRAENRRDPAPLDPGCSCETCRRYSRGYLRHLFTTGEVLASRLNTLHNLTYYLNLMRRIREAIGSGRYAEFCAVFLASAEARQ
jgi:queuine tRNA-ribosyltransferase